MINKQDVLKSALISMIERLSARLILMDGGWREWDTIYSEIIKMSDIVREIRYPEDDDEL